MADIVFLGDSITVGVRGGVVQADTFAYKIADAQSASYVNSGISGNSIAQMLARFDTDVTAHAPRWVGVMVGHNDTAHGTSLVSFESSVRQIIEKALASGIRPVLIPSPFCRETTIRNGMVPYHAITRKLAKRYGVALVDPYQHFAVMATVNSATYNGYYSLSGGADLEHPSPAGHSAISAIFGLPENSDYFVIPKTGGTSIPSGPTLFAELGTAGVTTNLEICVDAGDSASYSTGQTWIDRVAGGTGRDLIRGTGVGAEASDPAFNGTAGGLSSAEYFSTDGADRFVISGSNPSWINNIHKNNGVFTFALSIYVASVSTQQFILATMNNSSGTGFYIDIPGPSVGFGLAIGNGSSIQVNENFATAPSTGAWHTLIISYDEAAGASGSFIMQDGVAQTFDGVNASPSASNPTTALNVMQRGQDANVGLLTGSRIGAILGWSRALNQTEAEDVHDLLSARW